MTDLFHDSEERRARLREAGWIDDETWQTGEGIDRSFQKGCWRRPPNYRNLYSEDEALKMLEKGDGDEVHNQ